MKKFVTALVMLTLVSVFAVGASAKTVLKGDFDMNGKVNAADARYILRAGARIDEYTDEQVLISDLNGDGKITAMDARLVLRIAAQIDENNDTVEIGGETTTENTDNVVRTELSNGFSMSTEDFIKKYGGMRKVDTTDGTTEYTNDYVTVIHDPEMIYSGCINSISITGGNYMLCGVYAGMSSDDAIAMLKDDNWKINSQSDTQVILEQNAMRMKLAIDGGKVTFVEYYLGFSLVNSGNGNEQTTETTTKPEETTTEPEETTTEPTTKPVDPTTEPTTKPVETTEPTTTPPDLPKGNEDYESLPEQIKAYLLGEFSFEGFRYEKDGKTPVAMTFANGNVKASMSDKMSDGSTMTLEMLIDNSEKKPKLFFLNSSNMNYVEFSSALMALLGIDSDALDLGYSSVDINKIKVETKAGKLNGTDCTIYKIYTGVESCDIYVINDDIKKIINYDAIGNIKSQMDITTFRLVTADDATLKNYKKGTFLSVLGISLSDLLAGI